MEIAVQVRIINVSPVANMEDHNSLTVLQTGIRRVCEKAGIKEPTFEVEYTVPAK